MITIDTISKKYGKAEVLNVSSIEIPTGQSFGLVGNNGAGKTTLFNVILDLIRPTTGTVTSNNIVVSESETWKNFTGSFIDESFLIGYLTPEEYFQFIGDLRGMNTAEVTAFIAKFEDFFNDEIIGKKKYLRDLSKGNLDPTTQIRLKKVIKNLTDNSNITVLISSHDLIHVTEVCERIVVLDKGVVVKDISTSAATLKELELYFSV
jgi:ABC-2 type transport system ATP-binding protein